ncbi:MAG: alpha/beta hydrolase [Pseudomonadales bacterium]
MGNFRIHGLAKHTLLFLAYGALGVALTLITVFVVALNSRTDLDVWHLAELDEEFTTHSDVASFSEYLALEDRLFSQLDKQVYNSTGPSENDKLNRYKRDSLADPKRWPTNWNRSYEKPVVDPSATVLLLHGLSDSPYSLKHLAERLRSANAHVLGLRIPGHGTAPSGLVEASWQDMAAAVQLAVRHLAEQHPDKPIHIVGYSNGAALAVHYALSTLGQAELDPVDRLVLLSPEIGVTPVAAFAIWQSRLGHFLGLEKLAWNSILPEYDPFKYGSFAVNAGDLSHRITAEIQRLLDKHTKSGQLDSMPPIQAYTSVVDSTVLAPALVDRLLNRLPAAEHELIIFDINARADIEHLIKVDLARMINALSESKDLRFKLSLISNRYNPNNTVVERRWLPSQPGYTDTAIDLSWPMGIFSLSHVALPFPAEDPLYGGVPTKPSPGVALGNLALRGENDVLLISPSAMLRMRWNPFYPYLERRTIEFLDLQ